MGRRRIGHQRREFNTVRTSLFEKQIALYLAWGRVEEANAIRALARDANIILYQNNIDNAYHQAKEYADKKST